MATIEVSTWTELVNAINTGGTDDTIKLTQDINCNDDIPTGVAETISLRAKTIDGSYEEGGVIKNRRIMNLRSGTTPVIIFQIGDSVYLKNIDFLNLIIKQPLIKHSSNDYLEIRNCRFTGKRYCKLMETRSSDWRQWANTNIYSSFFNVPCYSTDSADLFIINFVQLNSNQAQATRAYNCWFIDTYTGTCTSNPYGRTAVSHIFLDGCRLTGEMVADSYFELQADALLNYFGTPQMQSVIDVDLKLTTTESQTMSALYSGQCVLKTPVTNLDDPTIEYTLPEAPTGTIYATAAQMQDAQWLYEHNFDIVPPNS